MDTAPQKFVTRSGRKLCKSKAWMFIMREEKNKTTDTPSRLAFLVRWASFKRNASVAAPDRRAAYQRWRGYRHSPITLGQCWACKGWADLFHHHIVQIQHGGTNNQLNLIKICGECHAVIHPWMRKHGEKAES